MSEQIAAKLPAHIGIIMDGNGRWAKLQNKPRIFGHKAGVEAIRSIVKASSKIGIKVLTLYAFSTENWKRPKAEVEGLMSLFSNYLKKEVNELHKNNVCFRIIGEKSMLSGSLVNLIAESEALTKNNTGLVLNIAVNYGGRDEIIWAVKEIARDIALGRMEPEDIDSGMLERHLYTAGLQDPDLIIRTSGELRLSNFLIWQSAYSELWFTDVLWPDFTEAVYMGAINDFQKRKRRYGGV
ncbi:MAG: isoprenyl transferase [Eubacteriaceae bacterium]|nr:isoprenyl transferase [Eubacteriaceae bacterium]